MYGHVMCVLRLFYKQIICILLLSGPSLLVTLKAQDMPFNRGVNLTNWFQESSARQIQFTKYTKKDFEQIKGLGCDVIRLPINLHYMTNGAPDYTLDPLFLDFLDEVVSWSEELGIHLIFDNHTFSPSVDTDPQIGEVLEKVWFQMADHYLNSSELIYYEILNEPHGITDNIWNDIQKSVIRKIRTVDAKHTIIIGPAGWNSFHNLDDMPIYEDDNLIYTFHFYDPFVFTHQGASWTDPSMVPLANVPFPYDAGSMPSFPTELEGSWIESAFLDYHNTGTVAKVQQMLDIAVNFKETRNIRIFCGEFGVYIPNSNNSDRVNWYDTVRKYLEQNGIAWTIWDYHGGFGIFEPGGNNLFDHDLNVPLLGALAFNVPPQSEYIKPTDSTGLILYSDYTGEGISNYSHGTGLIDYYSKDKPNNGNYCTKWTNASRYEPIGFDFIPNRDLSYLSKNGYALDLFVRGDSPGIQFDLRFIDTKTNEPDDHPWRMVYTLTDDEVEWDGRWHHVRIPLNDFIDQGAWDDGWFDPQGDFDWSDVDRFEIVSERQDLNHANLWFDNVIIADQDTARIHETSVFEQVLGLEDPQLLNLNVKVYPNPTVDILKIEVGENQDFSYTIMDMTGSVLFTGQAIASTQIDISNYPAGLYFLKISADKEIQYTGKIFKR